MRLVGMNGLLGGQDRSWLWYSSLVVEKAVVLK